MNTTTQDPPLQISQLKPAGNFRPGDLKALMDKFPEEGKTISIQLPMEESGAETRKNPILFKNAVKLAKEKLEKMDWNFREQFEEHLEGLIKMDNPEDAFWQHQSRGLALYLKNDGEIVSFSLPHPLSTRVNVGEYPDLTPLFASQSAAETMILAVSMGEISLYVYRNGKVSEVQLEQIPSTLDEAMKYDDPEKSLQFRATAPSGEGASHGTNAAYHGHGVTNDEERKRKVRRFYEIVDAGLTAEFPDSTIPLVLLGSPEVVSFFRETCSYPHLKAEHIDYHFSSDDQELGEVIQTHVESNHRAIGDNEISRLQKAIAQNTGSDSPQEIFKAAVEGRVETLLLAADTDLAGTYGEETHEIDVRSEDGDRSLLLPLMWKVLENGGSVNVLDNETRIPGEAEIAAIFRF